MEVRYETHAGRPSVGAAIVDAGLDAFNHAHAPLDEVRDVTCVAQDEQGHVIGGAIGRTWGACAELLELWVDDAYRRKSVGAGLVRRFEEHAQAQGCVTCYLVTFSFQAPDFYRRLGYGVAWEIAGFPQGIVKYHMVRTLPQ